MTKHWTDELSEKMGLPWYYLKSEDDGMTAYFSEKYPIGITGEALDYYAVHVANLFPELVKALELALKPESALGEFVNAEFTLKKAKQFGLHKQSKKEGGE